MPICARFGLTAAVFLILGIPLGAKPPGFAGAFRWSMQDARFGGFSGIEIQADGTTFIALTDRGAWTRGRLMRDAKGRIIGLRAEPLQNIRTADDTPIPPAQLDSEGLAVTLGGTIFISLEGPPRLVRYAEFGSPPEALPSPPDLSLPRRASFEALAFLPDGSVVTIAEDTRGSIGDFPVLRFTGPGWTLFGTLPRESDFLPVAADLGPDGHLYVLERAVRGFRGFAARVRAFEPGPNGLTGGTTVLQTRPGQHDNLEGLSVTQTPTGAIRLTMISDDNFNLFQTTEIVEYILLD